MFSLLYSTSTYASRARLDRTGSLYGCDAASSAGTKPAAAAAGRTCGATSSTERGPDRYTCSTIASGPRLAVKYRSSGWGARAARPRQCQCVNRRARSERQQQWADAYLDEPAAPLLARRLDAKGRRERLHVALEERLPSSSDFSEQLASLLGLESSLRERWLRSHGYLDGHGRVDDRGHRDAETHLARDGQDVQQDRLVPRVRRLADQGRDEAGRVRRSGEPNVSPEAEPSKKAASALRACRPCSQ